ncbi:MAG: DNA topology modulation protein [Bacteroidota bacterium]
MKRIMIIGSCGSGKSTLSHRLQEVTHLPLYHLDQYYWKPDWTETPNEEWVEIVSALAQKDEWIIDGNYGSTMDVRFQYADTIVFMNISTMTCLWRVLGRIWKYHGQVRPDMPTGCKERFDLDFLHYVATYNLLRRKRLLQKLELMSTEKKVVIIKNEKDINRFVSSIQT